MLIRRFHLSLSDRLDGRVLWRTHRTFSVLVDCVQAALVEGVFTQEVYRGQVQSTTTRHAPARLEYHRGTAQLGDFLLFRLGFRGVAGYQTLILEENYS